MYAKRNETIKRIVNGTLTLSKTHGFNRVTVSQIVNEVGINRGTFYRYFNDKNDVIETVENQILNHIDKFQSRLMNMNIHAIRKQIISGAFINYILQLFDMHREVLTLLLSDKGDINFNNKLEFFFTQMNYKTIGKLNFTINKKQKMMIATFLTGAVLNLLKLSLFHPKDYTADDIAKASYELIRDNLIHKL
ncbi:TetR/AcrR family transcriptional regulator (plasmid) [Nicoliella spurrieriana]|uniref:TetR/AcrR family transcriptional regulator n=1 Tax=Nicoliella spurrieriana TaxID=2925830 RepID=A0A976X4K8_9LACO|nr:TetR/AcrR family transcriptional regulator [Nicoliella spurrieriana]UQS85920.1 TetR/AcrR family transcriptional regulator [Nicoliella spurrieriana]